MSNDMREALKAIRWFEKKGFCGEIGSVKNRYWMAISNAIRQSQQAQGDNVIKRVECISFETPKAGQSFSGFDFVIDGLRVVTGIPVGTKVYIDNPPAPAAVPEVVRQVLESAFGELTEAYNKGFVGGTCRGRIRKILDATPAPSDPDTET